MDILTYYNFRVRIGRRLMVTYTYIAKIATEEILDFLEHFLINE